MPAFTEDLTITQLSGKPGAWRLWRTEQRLVYQINPDQNELDASGYAEGSGLVIVPAGFVTDGPSIPRILWAVLPVWGSWSRAGVVHDYLCCLIAMGTPHREAPTRTAADAIFREAMKACGVGILCRVLLYVGVRIGTLLNVKTTMVGYNAKLKAAMGAAAS